MYMSPLSFVLIVSSILFLFFAIDGLQRRKLNALHFIIFITGIWLVLGFVFIDWFQENFAQKFGVARWSDVIVYATLIVLWYFYFELLHEVVKQRGQTTRMITADALRSIYPPLTNDSVVWQQPEWLSHNSFLFLIRAFNEWSVIGQTIDTIYKAGYRKIVIVNDGSSDNTYTTVQEKISLHTDAQIYIVSHMINRWGWAANKTWLQFACKYMQQLWCEWLVTYDADGQMSIDDMDSFTTAIQHTDNYSIKAFLWSRFIEWASVSAIPFMRKCILRGSKIVTRLFNRMDVSDPHNGYRVLHYSILDKIFLTSDGMTYASELLESLYLHNIPYKEVPVHITYTDYSLAKWQKNRNAFKILFELIYKKIFFK